MKQKTTTRKLTPSNVHKARCPAGQSSLKIKDSLQPSLVLKVDAQGQKSWLFEQRQDGRLHSAKLGDFPLLGLDEARQLAQQQHALYETAAKTAPCPTLDEFYERHYWPRVHQHQASARDMRGVYRNHLRPSLGSLPLDQLNAKAVMQVQEAMLAQGLKPASVNRGLKLLSAIFKEAQKVYGERLAINPVALVPSLKENNLTHNSLTDEQLNALLKELKASASSDYLWPIIQLLALTGARKSEVLNLRWRDVDFKQQRWTLEQNKSGQTQYKPLSAAALHLLAQQLEHQQKNLACSKAKASNTPESPKKQPVQPTSDWVFPSPRTGRPFVNLFKSWNRCRIRAGVPQVRIHDLRHYFASQVLNAGYSLYDVQKLLNHAYASTTQRYAHFKHDRLLDSVNQIRLPCLNPASAFAQSLASAAWA